MIFHAVSFINDECFPQKLFKWTLTNFDRMISGYDNIEIGGFHIIFQRILSLFLCSRQNHNIEGGIPSFDLSFPVTNHILGDNNEVFSIYLFGFLDIA